MEVNFAVPDLTLQNLQGKTESLADYRSSVVLVNDWAIWCPPCPAEMPTLAAFCNEHKVEGFTIIAIEAGDLMEGVSQFVKSYGLRFTVWLDPEGASLRVSFPSSFETRTQEMVRERAPLACRRRRSH